MARVSRYQDQSDFNTASSHNNNIIININTCTYYMNFIQGYSTISGM